MEYKEFICAVEKEMNMKLEGGIRANLYTAIKNNGKKKEGIIVVNPEVNIFPTIYLEEFYERFREGESLDKIVRDILQFYEMVKCEHSWDTSNVERYEVIRNRIVFKLIHTEKNKELLKKAPHIGVLDLSIVFYALLEVNKEGTVTMLINHEHLQHWNVTKEELYSTACENVKRLLPAQLYAMRRVVDEILEPCAGKPENLFEHRNGESEDFMYVLSNSIRNLGAACMVYPEVLSMAGEIMGEDFYILPSSVHEVILVPVSKAPGQSELDEMVAEINETQVDDEEVLSGHAYFYERSAKRLIMEQHIRC